MDASAACNFIKKDKNLYLESKDGNEYDNNAVAVVIDGKTGGHIPKNFQALSNAS